MIHDPEEPGLPGGQPGLPSRRYGPVGLDDGFGSGPEAPTSSPAISGPEETADGGEADWEPAEVAPSAEAASRNAEPRENLAEWTSSCVLMGPMKAGKTTLLQALDQACSCPPDGDDRFRLEFLGGKGTDELAEIGIKTIMDDNYAPMSTETNKKYEASITAIRKKSFWRPERQFVSHLKIIDGPGGALFPHQRNKEYFDQYLAPWEKELIPEARVAETLVLCVDATDPQPDLLTRYMRNILAKLGQPYQRRLEEPFGYRVLKVLRLADEVPPPGLERRIAARRFLLLLTKVDQLVSREPDWPESDKDYEPPMANRLAARLSPVQMACELLDESNLLRILNALRPDADFAVGLTSAWGFHPFTGRPFMEEDNPVGMSTQDRSQRLLNWRPFGVRETLLFITAGVASGPVERVKSSSLGIRLHAPIFDVPAQFFDFES
jgi:hypothetical protein